MRLRSWAFATASVLAAVILAVVWLVRPGIVAAQQDCTAERCAVQSQLEADCPCDGFSNHGGYVSCVSKDAPTLVSSSCTEAFVDCAARSLCGRKNDDAVVCDLPQFGSCDTAIGKCTNNAATSCTSFRDCGGSTNCRIAKSAQQCVAKGGTVSTRTSCCEECGASTTTTTLPTTQCCLPTSPGGAFLTCMVLSPTDCTSAGGLDAGPGSCTPNPCPPTTTTTTVIVTTTTTSTTLVATTTTTTLPTTQCCLPTSPGGAFLTCMVLSPTDCATAGGADVGPGNCGAPPPCPPSTTTSTTVVETTSTTATTATTMTTTSSTTTTTVGSASAAFVGTLRQRPASAKH